MGKRAASRERTISEVLRLGREQLSDVGAAQLSLRAIARDLGLVSSAVYRYFPSRDALLTALIIEAYDELGTAAETAAAAVPRGHPHRRVRAIARAAREWALANPNEYALIYGSPVPGYAAPEETIGPASRVPALLIDTLRDAPAQSSTFPTRGRRAVRPLQSQMAPDVNTGLLSLGFTLWEFLIGAISLEVFGHQENVIDPDLRSTFFDEQVKVMANLVFDATG